MKAQLLIAAAVSVALVSGQASSSYSTIIDQNLEVTGRVFETCNRGDLNARWANGNKHCYMLFTQEKTWFMAKRACENLGGYLATITNEDEMNFIWSQFGAKYQANSETWKGPWIGLSDAVDEGKWQWITGEIAVVGQDSVYSNWYTGEPDNCCGGEDCSHISGGHWGNKWNDNKCHFNLPFICEKNY